MVEKFIYSWGYIENSRSQVSNLLKKTTNTSSMYCLLLKSTENYSCLRLSLLGHISRSNSFKFIRKKSSQLIQSRLKPISLSNSYWRSNKRDYLFLRLITNIQRLYSYTILIQNSICYSIFCLIYFSLEICIYKFLAHLVGHLYL